MDERFGCEGRSDQGLGNERDAQGVLATRNDLPNRSVERLSTVIEHGRRQAWNSTSPCRMRDVFVDVLQGWTTFLAGFRALAL